MSRPAVAVRVRPDLTRKVLDTGRPDISPVHDQRPISRAFCRDPGANSASRSVEVHPRSVYRGPGLDLFAGDKISFLPPEHWRVSVLEPERARSSAARPRPLSARSLYRQAHQPALTACSTAHGLVLVEPTSTIRSLYVVRTMSKLYPGWSAALGCRGMKLTTRFTASSTPSLRPGSAPSRLPACSASCWCGPTPGSRRPRRAL